MYRKLAITSLFFAAIAIASGAITVVPSPGAIGSAGITFTATDGTKTRCFAPAFGLNPEYLQCDSTGLYMPTATSFVKTINVDDTIGGVFSFTSGGNIGFTAGSSDTQHMDIATNTQITGSLTTSSTKTAGTCTLDGASPSKCTAAVRAGTHCGCFAIGTTAAKAIGVAANLVTTTLTCTAANGLTDAVNYICL